MIGSHRETDVLEFLLDWAKGHFIPIADIVAV